MKPILYCLFFLCFSLPVQAERLQFGNVLYEMPENWTGGKVERGTKVLLPRARLKDCRSCRIYLGVGQAKEGSLEAFFRQKISGMLSEEDRAELEIKVGPKPEKTAGFPGLLAAWSVGRKIYVGVAVELRQRYEFAAFRVTWSGPGSADKATRYFEPFTRSLQFVSEGAASLLADARSGSLSGVFRGYYMGVGVGAGGTGTLVPKYKTLVFWQDGHFFDGTPPAGLAPLDPDRLLAQGVTRFGVYEERGRTVLLTYASGRTEEMTPLSGGGWKLGKRDMIKAEVLPDGSKVAGVASSMMFGGFTPGSGVSGATAASSAIRLFENGSYTSNTALSTSGAFAGGGGFAGGGKSANAGTYTVQNGLIRFTALEGKPIAPRLIYRYLGKTYVGGRELE